MTIINICKDTDHSKKTRSEFLAQELLLADKNLSKTYVTLIIQVSFEYFYPFEKYSDWNIEISYLSASNYFQKKKSISIDNLFEYIRELWDIH